MVVSHHCFDLVSSQPLYTACEEWSFVVCKMIKCRFEIVIKIPLDYDYVQDNEGLRVVINA